MRKYTLAAALLTVGALTLSACSSTGEETASNTPTSIPNTVDAKGKSIDVWIMQDDYNQETIDAINAKFEERTGATANVEIQQWDGITTKLSTALSTTSTPDIVDIGNTQVAMYAANGALLDVTPFKEGLQQGQTWLGGLEEPATIDGKLYAVPGFAGARSVIYNKKMWEDAGIVAEPTTWDELGAALDAVEAKNDAPDFSALYLPGQHWYVGMQFVWDHGGEIATSADGKWAAGMSSTESQAALESWKKFQNTYSTEASRTLNTDSPEQEQLFADGKTSAIVATNGALGVITAANPEITEEDLGSFPLPSEKGTGGQPVMLGGSDWGIATKSDDHELALIWTQIAVSNEIQVEYVFGSNGWVPNSQEAINEVSSTLPAARKGFFDAALNSKATPASPGWAELEGALAPQDLFAAVASGSKTVAEAGAAFDAQVTEALK